MAVAKRQGREKTPKIEQRKVWGPGWGPQVKQTAFLASPIYKEPGEERIKKKKKIERGAKGQGVSLSLPLSHSLLFFLSLLYASIGLACPHALRVYFLNKTDLKHGVLALICVRAVAWFVRGLQRWSIPSHFCCDETEPRKVHTPLKILTNLLYSASASRF